MKRFFVMVAVMVTLVVLPFPISAAELKVAGKSAALMDVATGTVLYESNSHERLAPASVTKVMTMLLIMEAVDSGTIAMTDTVTASETASAKGGSQIYLKAGETMTVSDMLKSIAVSSANDCACAMAEHIAGSEEAFVARMNERAAQLGMQNTLFQHTLSPLVHCCSTEITELFHSSISIIKNPGGTVNEKTNCPVYGTVYPLR